VNQATHCQQILIGPVARYTQTIVTYLRIQRHNHYGESLRESAAKMAGTPSRWLGKLEDLLIDFSVDQEFEEVDGIPTSYLLVRL